MSPNIQKYIYSPNLPICPFSDTNNINERLQDIHNIQSLKLREKQRKKFFRDGINPNKKRQGGNEDFQDTKKLIETKMTQSSICHQKI